MKPVLLALMLSCAVLACGQSIHDVNLCELESHPEKYNMQRVRLRAELPLAFEDFALFDATCNDLRRPGVWVEFGGDQSTPATYCCGSHERKRGSHFTINGVEVSLIRDESFDLFIRRLTAERVRKPDGSPCYGERRCYFYRVTATFTGLFVAGSNDLASLPGYGHLGCCHLLVVSRVSDVSAERQKILAGGSFRCDVDTWTPDAETASALDSGRNCDTEECKRSLDKAFDNVAQHWNHAALSGREWHQNVRFERGVDETLIWWESEDMLTNYKAKISKSGEITFQRTGCSSVTAPFPPTTPIACRNFFYEFNKKDIDQLPRTEQAAFNESGLLEQISAAGFKHARQKWAIAAPPDIRFGKCEEPNELGNSLVSQCYYTSSDSTFDASVTVRKFDKSDQKHASIAERWMPWSASAYICQAE